MESAHKVAEDLYALPSYLEVPMLGLVPIDAFLVNTGMAARMSPPSRAQRAAGTHSPERGRRN